MMLQTIQRRIFAAILLAIFAVSICRNAHSQTVQPVIVEYTGKADGKIELTNNTLTPMAVVLEPKSFSISNDGRGVYRALDPGIHLSLSTSSVRLEPQQTYYVFYKTTADTLPAWFTIYATFSPIQASQGMKVRVMLPHTVYLYQKQPINKETIRIDSATYVPDSATPGSGKVLCDIENTGQSLVRVQEVRAIAGKTNVSAAGFPLLPNSSRHLAIDWNEKATPDALLFHFPHFDLKEPLVTKER